MSARADGGPLNVLASNASYYPNGALKQFTYGNGIVHTMTQNARQLPSRSTDGVVLDLGTTFDANGNVATVTDYTGSARQSRTLAYDGLDRLTGAASPMFGTAAYSYDALDNLTRVQLGGGLQPRDHTYCYNATSNRLEFVRTGPDCASSPAAIALTYDVQGNLAGKNGTAYAFDYGNRLRSTAGLGYRYDAEGRRVRQDSAGTQLAYSQYAKDGRLVWQQDEAAGKRINNVYFVGSLLAEISRPLGSNTATISYFHTDALGSPIAKTDAAGAILETSEYEPYGKLLNRANDNRAGYAGHVMDASSGLTYMQQRYYDPQIGRFLSVDPVTADAAGGTNFNRYWYADNSPYRFTDPDGRQSRCSGSSCNAVNVLNNLSNAAQWLSGKADAVDEKLNKVDVRLEGSVALGPGVEGSISLLHGDGQIGFIPVGEGADISISVQPKEGFKADFSDKPVDAPIQFSGAAEAKGGFILHGGAEANFNPGGTAELVPKVGVGIGEIVKYSPTLNFIKWGALDEKKTE